MVSRPNGARSVVLAIAVLTVFALAFGFVAAHPATAQAKTKYDSGADKRVTTTTYKYKTVKVPEKYVNQVNQQQVGFFKVKPGVEGRVLP